MLQSRLTLYLDKSLIQIEKYMFEKDETHLIEVTTFTMPKIFIPIVMTSSMGLSFAVSCLLVYFSKAHPWNRRYSARIKTSNTYNIWAPVNPIVQGTSCAG